MSIHSTSYDVRQFVCCLLSVPFVGYWKQESWRLLVKDCIAKIAKLKTPS